jgi:hypothetical protein
VRIHDVCDATSKERGTSIEKAYSTITVVAPELSFQLKKTVTKYELQAERQTQ